MVNNLKILHSPRSKVLIFSRNPMPVHHIGHRILVLESVDSSNNYAMGLVRNREAIHGQLVFTLEQTAGKGQKGRRWVSAKGVNIMCSIVLETASLQAQALFPLSMAMALGSYDFLKKHAGDECSIKWPNDLYWRDRKAGGILIENSWKGKSWQFAIVGIGININQVEFGEGGRKPVSLKQVTGKTYELMDLLQELAAALELRWQQLLSGREAELLEAYNKILFSRNAKVRLQARGEEFETEILGVDISGELLTSHPVHPKLSLGEVEWIW